nr:hypothetical protein BaRGS_001199 [Batillaria attramentaria]
MSQCACACPSESVILSPLMQEYDGTLQQLQGESEEQKSQMSHLRQQLEELLTENDRLRQDMKDIINQQLGLLRLHSVPDWHKKKVISGNQWRNKHKKFKISMHRVLLLLNVEMETLQSDLRQVRQELMNSQRTVTELKKANHSLQQQLAWRDDEKAEKIFKEGITDSKMAELQRIMEDLRQRLASSTRDVDDLKREKSGMEARITELTRRLADTEHRENEAIQQVRDAVAMAETSVFEKDQAELQMRHREEEVSQLHDSITKVINEAGVRTRQEVDNVRKQCNERVEKLTEELHTLELENTEKQASLDRLLREKRAVESELQKIARDGKLEGSRTKEAIEELSKRVSDAERSRDDLLMKLENMQNALDKERDENQQMKESYDAKLQSVQDRLAALQQEYDHANDDRLQHVDAINTLTKKLQQAEQEKESVHRKFLKELALIEQEQQTKTRGFEVQLQTTEDARRTSVGELRKLLNAQQRMSARCRRHHTKERQLASERQSLLNELSRSQREKSQDGVGSESLSKSAMVMDDLHSSRSWPESRSSQCKAPPPGKSPGWSPRSPKN